MLKKFFVFFFVNLFILTMPTVTWANEVIPAGTAITITNEKEISADDVRLNQNIDFIVQTPVIVNNVNVIKPGALVSAQVLQKKNNFIFGVPGKIQIGNFKLKTQNGNIIPLRGEITNKGEAKYWCHISWIFCLGIVSFFVKGEDGIIPGGTSITVYTQNEVNL